MRHILLLDLFSTLVSGGDDERGLVHQKIAGVLGVEAGAFAREFDATAYERFIGAHGDLENTLRVVAARCGGAPGEEQVRKATEMRRGYVRQLLNAVPEGTVRTLVGLKAAGWRIGLVSDATAEVPLEWVACPLAPYFEVTAFSAEVGAVKPDPKMYLTACHALAVKPRCRAPSVPPPALVAPKAGSGVS
ncbi:HAD family hydrolase [Kribbella pittospori]|uniref:HAD family hydrolase n=1 Tax=Kribbella pittospori TaxID=722689 RepID=A0A4R0KK93_9ACTN|nr:HAD family hydrolase [Kribbella pittospori]TCC61091.1 HAD family hydrolase [Kribbella pittospori]